MQKYSIVFIYLKALCFVTGFLADKLETYAPAFYFAAAALLVCSLLPFLLLCIKVHKPLESEDESNQTHAASEEEILRETVC